jgi:hypothetical protein
MTVDKLKRVMRRVRARSPVEKVVSEKEFARAIMIECGTSSATYRANMASLRRIGWIKQRKRKVHLTDRDLTEDFD